VILGKRQLPFFVNESFAINAARNGSLRAIERIVLDSVETDLEGVVWALQGDGTDGREGLRIIEEGDRLNY
jgi:hypothetical protein